MKTLIYLIRRNTKLFFKDKGVFFTSLIAPLILLLLFVTFLGGVYRDSFLAFVPEGVDIPARLIDGFVGGWLFSSLLAVCCVTVSFTANMIMVQDKVTGRLSDLNITPVSPSVLALGYYVSTALITLIICYITLCCGFIYLAVIGWYLTAADVLLTVLDVFILVLFGTALSSIVCCFLSSQGGITAVTTIVSAAYGFLCGAYMPISSFTPAIRNIILFLPGTYGTSLLHGHLMGGALNGLEGTLPTEAVDALRDGFDVNLSFFDNRVQQWQMYVVLVGSVILLAAVYVLLTALGHRKKRIALKPA